MEITCSDLHSLLAAGALRWTAGEMITKPERRYLHEMLSV
jgi:hypothetical protein